MDLLKILALLALAGCTATEGDVLTSVGGDGSVADAAANGDAGGCPLTPACPTPSVGDIGVCGQVLDLVTSAPVLVNPPEVRVFDLDDLENDPLNAIALAVVTPDECGFFQTTIDGDAGLVVLATGDEDTGHRRVTTAVAAAPSTTVRVTAWALRRATDEAWSDAAGLIGLSFAELGSLMPIYIDSNQPAVGPFQGTPVSGVTLSATGATASNDFYFADADPLARAVLDPDAIVTGTNGSAIAPLPATTFTFSGTRAGCTFGQGRALLIPTAVHVQELVGSCN